MVSALSSRGHMAHQSRVLATSVLHGRFRRHLLTTTSAWANSHGHDKDSVSRPLKSTAVNFHFTRKCNYSCEGPLRWETLSGEAALTAEISRSFDTRRSWSQLSYAPPPCAPQVNFASVSADAAPTDLLAGLRRS